jgi:cation transport ATPase
MIILTPLILSGISALFFREYIQKKRQISLSTNYRSSVKKISAETIEDNKIRIIDDVIEIKHYQNVSWTTLTLSSIGWLFFPTLYLISISFLSYGILYLFKTILYSKAHKRNPLITLFEVISISSSFASKQLVLCSLLLVGSFSLRKIGLQFGNFAKVGLPEIFNPKFAQVWVLHNQIEVETNLNDVQKGDILVVRAGEVIFINGVVIEGSGEVIQYALEGTTQIRTKYHNDWVFAFSRVKSGYLHIQYR